LPAVMVFPEVIVIFPLVVSVSPEGLPVLVVDRSAEVAVESLAVIVIAPFVVPILSLIKTLRPALMASVLPLCVFVQPLVMRTSLLACKMTLAFTEAIVEGSIVVVPAALFAKRLFVPFV